MAMENTQIIDVFPIKTSIFIVDFPASHGSLPEGKCCVTLDFSNEKSTRTEGWGPESIAFRSDICVAEKTMVLW